MNRKFKGEYERNVKNFYKKNNKYIEYVAKKIKSLHYSIPIDVEDLISFSFLNLLESENKLEYFRYKTKNENIDIFFKKKIRAFMFTYCNIYKTKNHQILNNAILNEENELLLENSSENYEYEELFNFLDHQEFKVMYNIFVNKMKRKEICSEMNISKFKLRKIENSAREKIFKNYS